MAFYHNQCFEKRAIHLQFLGTLKNNNFAIFIDKRLIPSSVLRIKEVIYHILGDGLNFSVPLSFRVV